MPYAALADGVVIVHLGFVVFVALGGILSWRWPRLLWAHVAAVVWGLGIVTVGQPCRSPTWNGGSGASAATARRRASSTATSKGCCSPPTTRRWPGPWLPR
jgi:hypothetical protein